MKGKWMGGLAFPLLVAAAGAVLLAGVFASAEEWEDPCWPTPTGSMVTLPLADNLVDAYDVGGSAIDAKEALEPQLTVLMLTTDVSLSPGQTLGVQTSPTFQVWTQ
jgi:hypothetical protein